MVTYKLPESFLDLNAHEKKQSQIKACTFALSVWKTYCAQRKEMIYSDSIVGMAHRVEKDLPEKALQAVIDGLVSPEITQAYREPIVALQDMDIDWPDQIEFAYYAIDNLYRKYALNLPIDDWLIINQALSSESNSSQWEDLLESFLA